MGKAARVSLGLAIWGAGACSRAATVPWPLPDWPDAQAFLVLFRTDTSEELIAFDRSSAPSPLPFALDAERALEATALGLARPLSTYAIAPGAQTLVPRARGRAWPTFLGVAERSLETEDWQVGSPIDETALVERALDAAPLCPPTAASSQTLGFGNPLSLVPLDGARALVSTSGGLWVVTATLGAPVEQPLPGRGSLASMWVDADGTLVAGATGSGSVHVGRWDGRAVGWSDSTSLRAPAEVVAMTGAPDGAVYGVTNDGALVRVRPRLARVERIFSFQATRMNSGAGVALRGPEALVAYSNVDAGRIVFVDGPKTQAELVFPGPIDILKHVDGLGVVAGSALGFAVLAPGEARFEPLGAAPLELRSLVGTRDGFIAFGADGRVVRHDRRSGYTCPPQPLAPAEFRAAVALDDQTILALEQPGQPTAPMTAWRLEVPRIPF